jgi:hypothetical protein
MWKFTEVADAPPVIVLVATKTCFRSINEDELAATLTAVAMAVPFNASVKVCADPEVLVATMLETTVVVEAGTVYRVVAVFVVAAPLNKTLVTVAIIYNAPIISSVE